MIGNPQSFLATLQRIGLSLSGSLCFPDHHNFTVEDLKRIVVAAKSSGASAMVCTHKDLVKVQHLEAGSLAAV